MLIGYVLCGSFCTFSRSISVMERLIADGHELMPIMSETAYTTDTRFGKASEHRSRIETLCGRSIIHTVETAEPLGPKLSLDLLIAAPLTGNSLAKLANGITDTAAAMACKAHMRTDRPLLLALASNDAMSANLKNIAALLMRKNVFFVPMEQDDPVGKPHSLVAQFERIPEAAAAAMAGRQLRPLFK